MNAWRKKYRISQQPKSNYIIQIGMCKLRPKSGWTTRTKHPSRAEVSLRPQVISTCAEGGSFAEFSWNDGMFGSFERELKPPLFLFQRVPPVHRLFF